MPLGGTDSSALHDPVGDAPTSGPGTSAEAGPADPLPHAQSRLRQLVYALTLALLAFVQEPGNLVGDTKFDLVVDPGRFMARALQMWEGSGYLGQIQNQAYGYFFPMGPFFWLGKVIHLDMWIVQRLWWTLVLCTAFFGVLRVARELRIGRPWAQVVAAFGYALSCHVTSVIGATSIEIWPSAVAPWILWCVVRGTSGGSPRRWAAIAGLLLAACGGVNAAAVLGALPVAACWLLTRRGRVAWTFAGWWVVASIAATAWWVVALLLMGRYSFPFLDYIESASVTTMPTGLPDVLGGTSDWVHFYSGTLLPAGYALATSPYLLLNAATLVGFGLAGIARRDNPIRGFLFLSLVVGCLLVSFGYAGAGHGWWAEPRQELLDGVLAPFRNVHKFDNVIRLPLALGVAHLLGSLTLTGTRESSVNRIVAGAAIFATAVTVSPWWLPKIPPTGPIESVPTYWQRAGSYLDSHDDGTTTLVVPAASTGLYLWGSPRDDVLQPLTTSSWGARSAIPFTQPGAVVLLNALTEVVESGRPSPALARTLAANGIERVLVRNDLNRLETGAPDPVAVHSVLDQSPGIEKEKAFGPVLGTAPVVRTDDGTRIAPGGGLSGAWSPVEIYRVTLPVAAVTTIADTAVGVASGGRPGDGLLGGSTAPTVLGAPPTELTDAPVELSDSLRRREEDFAEVRSVESATMTADQPWLQNRPVHQRQMFDDQARWESTVVWRGVRDVTASSSSAWLDTFPPIERGRGPEAAVDGSRGTSWASAQRKDPVGQWWQADLEPGTTVGSVDLELTRNSGVSRIELTNGHQRLSVDVPRDNRRVSLQTGWGPSDHLRVTAVSSTDDVRPFGLVEVAIGGVTAERSLRLPAAPEGRSVDAITLHRDPGTDACRAVEDALACHDDLVTSGDDGPVLDREIDLGAPATYDVQLTGSWTGADAVTTALVAQLPYTLATTQPASTDVRAGPLALVDDDPATAWISSSLVANPQVTVGFDEPTTVEGLQLTLSDNAAAVPPTAVQVTLDGQTRTLRVPEDGRVDVGEPMRGRLLTIRVVDADRGYDTSGAVEKGLTVGIGSLGVLGAEGTDLLALPGQQFEGACGAGPDVAVNGTTVSTSYRASLGEVMSGAVRLAACEPSVDLSAGLNEVRAPANDLLTVDGIRLARTGADVGVTTPQALTPTTWGNEHRTVDVAAADHGRLLVVSQNFNEGWRAEIGGQRLRPQLVDGWRQGWWLPAGSAGTITMTFEPQATYRAGLIGGIVAVLVVVAMALVPRRGSRRAAAGVRRAPVPLVLAGVTVSAGLLGGSVAAVAVAVLLLIRWWRPRVDVAVACGALAVAAGTWNAYARPEQGLSYTDWVQWLLVVAVLLVVPLDRSRPKGPLFRRFMKGRSIV